MQYRLDFLIEILGISVMYSAQILNINIIIARFDHIDGWAFHEMAFLYALAVLATGAAQMFFTQFVELGDTLVKGEFDRFLIRPLNPFVLYLGSKVSAASFGHLIFAGTIFIWAALKVQMEWSVVNLAYLALVVLGGALIQGAAIIVVGTLSFWFQRTGTMFYTVVIPSRELIFYPVTVFPRLLQVVLTFVVPFAFINYYPAHALLGREGVLFHPALAYLTPVVGLVCFAGAYLLWRQGTMRYTGTGS
jgi:ABC-2 type transport system permease protein